MALKDIKPRDKKETVITFRANSEMLTQLEALQERHQTTRQRILEELISDAYGAARPLKRKKK